MSMSLHETSLYQIVLAAIHSGHFDEKPLGDLIESVEKEYLGKSNTPWTESSKQGLKTEIRDSVKAITYGYYSIKEYNSRRKR